MKGAPKRVLEPASRRNKQTLPPLQIEFIYAVPDLKTFLTKEYNACISKYVPETWRKRAILLIRAWTFLPENLYPDDLLEINDRFVIVGTRTFTWKFVYLLAQSCQQYTFEECYEEDEGAEAQKVKMEALLELENNMEEHKDSLSLMNDEYAWKLSEEFMSRLDYKPTAEHARRLRDLAETCGMSYLRVWGNDYDIRSRKEIPLDHPMTITTEFGCEYLFFVFLDPGVYGIEEKGDDIDPSSERALKCVWIKVGHKCALASCNKRNPKFFCSRCGEARYCDQEHQKQDWHIRHKVICKK